MRYIIYLFFKYYSKGATKQVPYLKSVSVFLLLLFINFFSIAVLISPDIFRRFNFLSRIQLYFFFTIVFSIGYLIMKKLVPERAIREYETNKNIKLHGWLLFIYVSFSIIFLLYILIRLRDK